MYKGMFEYGMRHGQGTWMSNNTSMCDVYKGSYLYDKKHGEGEYKWTSGNLYKGGYECDKRHGYGEMYWNDGSVYKGNWKMGIQHGYGDMRYKDGSRKAGNFINNMYIDANTPITLDSEELKYVKIRDSEPVRSKIIEGSNEKSIPVSNATNADRNEIRVGKLF